MYQAPRGTSDILPTEQKYWRYIEDHAVRICRLYGYERINSPTFEDTRLFLRSVGEGTDIVEKQMYTCEDRGGSEITLRPEGTAPVCRAYIEHGMHNWPHPVKLYYFASIFRYERPQAGRYREHHQFGAEAIGESDPSLDAEVIDMAWRFFHTLGLNKISLQINSIGCKKCRPEYVKAVRDYYRDHMPAMCPDCQKRLERSPLRLLDCKTPSCQEAADQAPPSIDYLCPECARHFELLQGYLRVLGLKFDINHRLVRGLDYYTKTVFEIQPEAQGGQSALGGGGRYDDLIAELGGRPTPAIGFAAGIERVILNLKAENVPILDLPRPQVFVAYLGEAAKDKAMKLTSRLRQAGIGVLENLGDKSLKAQLRQANTLGARYAVIIGEDELKAGTAMLRDMSTSEQHSVPSDELNQYLVA